MARDRCDHIVDVGQRPAAREPYAVPLGVVLAVHPEQPEADVSLGPPGVLQVVSVRGTLPRCIEGPPVPGPLRLTRIRDAQEAPSLLHFRDQGCPDIHGGGLWNLGRTLNTRFRFGWVLGLGRLSLLGHRGGGRCRPGPSRRGFRPVWVMAVLE